MNDDNEITLPEFPLVLFPHDIPVIFFPCWCIVYLISSVVYWLGALIAIVLNKFNKFRQGKPPERKPKTKKLRQ